MRPRHRTHPSHVHRGREQREVGEGCVREDTQLLIGNNTRAQVSDWDVFAALRTCVRDDEIVGVETFIHADQSRKVSHAPCTRARTRGAISSHLSNSLRYHR